MGKIKEYLPVKLIAAVTVNSPDLYNPLITHLESKFSPIDLTSDWYSFDKTNHYRAEMGENLIKRFVSFQELIPAESLPEIKLATNQLEDEWAVEGARRVNLDPGYITLPKLVLATTKDFSHRLYLGKGIFGDIHLAFHRDSDSFEPQAWTYPDYRQREVLAFFNRVREAYRLQLGHEMELQS